MEICKVWPRRFLPGAPVFASARYPLPLSHSGRLTRMSQLRAAIPRARHKWENPTCRGHACGDGFLGFPPGKQTRVRKRSLLPPWSEFGLALTSSRPAPSTPACRSSQLFIKSQQLPREPAVPAAWHLILSSFTEIFYFLEISTVHFKATLLYSI